MPGNPFILSLVIIWSMMTTVYVISLIKDDYSVVDIFWPIGFLLIALFLLDWNGSINEILVKVFVTIWSVKLSAYLLYRILKHGPDKRYKELQAGWGKWHKIQAFFKVFMLQGAFMYLISMPVTCVVFVIEPHAGWIVAGCILWILGFVLETIADIQLYTFRLNPSNKGKYLTSGLFRISRHPNYLGEILLWFGIALIAMPNAYIVIPLLGPLVLTFALYKFSGVPYAERNRKGKAFEAYVTKTGAIFPKLW